MITKKYPLIFLSIMIMVVNLGAAPFASMPDVIGDNDFGYQWELIENFDGSRWTTIAQAENKLQFANLTGGWATINDPTDPGTPDFLSEGFTLFDQNATDVWVSVNGLIGLGIEGAQEEPDNTSLPYDPLPNAIVAGFWSDLTMAGDPTGGIYYRRFVGAERPLVCTASTRPGFAASTNECAIFQWDQVLEYGGHDRRNTFQIVLYDTGEIHMLYHTIQPPSVDFPQIATVGLEANDGVYGVQVSYNGDPEVKSGDELVFYYPEPGPRHKVRPIYQSDVVARSGTALERVLSVTVTNNGDDSVASEVYSANVEFNVKPAGWNAEVLLGDTNGDGKKDTGGISQGQSLGVQVKITAPLTANVGEYLDAKVVFTSQDGLRTSDARIVVAYSAPYAQIIHNSDLYLRTVWDQHPVDRIINGGFNGANMSLAHIQGLSFFVAWEKAIYGTADIQYAIVNALGDLEPAVFQNTQNKDESSTPQDSYPAVGVGVDGRPAYAYIRLEYAQDGSYLFNVRFSILNSNGSPVCRVQDFDAPGDPCNIRENLTKNSISTNDDGPIYENPRLAVTSAGKFVITWTTTREVGPDNTRRNIEMAVINPDGTLAFGPAPIFEGAPNVYGYFSMALTKFNGSNVLVAAVKSDETTKQYQIVYKIVDANGNTIVAETPLGIAGNYASPDAVQLPSGEGVIAWKNNLSEISFAMIDSAGNVKPGLPSLVMPNTRPMQAVSVTTEPHGNVVLTWTDIEDDYLYYALINKNGSILTPPMIIAKDPTGGLVLSSELGYGNAFFDGKAFTFLPLLIR